METLAVAATVITVIAGVYAIVGGTMKGVHWLHSKRKSPNPLVAIKENLECRIRLSPSVHSGTIVVMNGGTLQGDFANVQIRFGSETDLELVDAALFHASTMIKCEIRGAKLEGGKAWNGFLFASSALPYVPDELLLLKLRVCDHGNHCCELVHEFQMKQFPHPDYTGKISGRWEIHPIGIFKIRCSDNKIF